MIKMFLALPSTGTREDAQTYALRRLEKKYGDKIQFVYPEIYVGRIFHDHARNKMSEQFMESGCDVMWFLDSDVVPNESVLDLITEHYDKWDLAGAPYPVWMSVPGKVSQQVIFTVYKKDATGKMQAAAVPQSGTEFVDGIATGCIFVKRKVLEALEAPYFEFKYDPITRDIVEGEDLGFCRKASDKGFKFFVDYALVCHHFKKVSLLEVNNYALEYAQQAVLAYDQQIRQVIAKRKLSVAPRKSNLLDE